MDGDDDVEGQELPIACVNVQHVNEDGTFTARWYARIWQGFETPNSMSFGQFRSNGGSGAWLNALDDKGIDMVFDPDVVVPVKLSWKKASRQRITLTKRSTDNVKKWCKDNNLTRTSNS